MKPAFLCVVNMKASKRREGQRVAPLCANCGIEIEWAPTLAADEVYCCGGCARGGPCICDYSDLPTAPIVLAATHAFCKQRRESESYWRR